ncbi:MAG TPA: hypothetical protein VKZ79_13305 [Alphaproteobacteria bacterium]|nr:hypothetical protein [Alphaproteobacteria bacterium]
MATSVLDDETVLLVNQLKARYRMGLPVMAPTSDERPLRPEEVVNRDLDLGAYQHPVVLTLIASKDPLNATALAASSRLVASAREEKVVAALARLAGQLTCHSDVRTGIDIAQKHDFAPTIADRIGRMALEKVDDERSRSFRSLVELLRRLGEGEEVPGNFICAVLRLGFAADLRRDTLKSMLTALFASPVLRPRILSMLGETVPFFPRDLLIGIAAEINHMPADSSQTQIKREMQDALARRGVVRRVPAIAEPRLPPRKPDIRPWMPMIQKASEIRAKRAQKVSHARG